MHMSGFFVALLMQSVCAHLYVHHAKKLMAVLACFVTGIQQDTFIFIMIGLPVHETDS